MKGPAIVESGTVVDSDRTLREGLFLAILLGVAIGVRLLFVTVFPTLPFSDFLALIGFGLHLRDHGFTAPTGFWALFSAGLPMLLALLYDVFPNAGPAAARIATAVATGLLPLAPFLLWRSVVCFRVRLLAGTLLAVWPGQVIFTGVVAQDNWVLLPAVGLASLAVRRLRDPTGRCHPIAAGLLYCAAAAIRQEMVMVLLPLAVVSSFSRAEWGTTRRNAAILVLSGGLPLLALAGQRYLATGRLALTTEHGGLTVLGSFVPGAFASGWIDPRHYVGVVEPSLLSDNRRYFHGAWSLGWNEAKRRPGFHALRMTTQTLRLAMRAEGQNLFSSVKAPEALPRSRRDAGQQFARRAAPWLHAELAIIQGLFAAALMVGLWRRDAAILMLGLCVILKILLQAVVSPMPRLLVPATALELLAIALAFGLLREIGKRRRSVLLAVAVAVPIFLAVAVPPLEKAVEKADQEEMARRAAAVEVVAPSPRPSPGGRGDETRQ